MCISNGGNCSVFKHSTLNHVHRNLILYCFEIRHYYTWSLGNIYYKQDLTISKMNSSINIIKITIFLFIVWGISSTIQGQTCKRVADFKTIKKNIDTLVVLPSFVDIKIIDVDKKIFNDTIYEKVASKLISDEVNNLLKGKYSIHIAEGQSMLTNVINSDLNVLLSKLDQSKRIIPNIEIENSIIKLTNDNVHRYYAINIFSGLYKTKARLKQEEKELLPKSIAVTILTLGNAYLAPNSVSYSIMRTIIFDKKERKVLLYKYSSEMGAHPKSNDIIKNYILKNYKTIYYK